MAGGDATICSSRIPRDRRAMRTRLSRTRSRAARPCASRSIPSQAIDALAARRTQPASTIGILVDLDVGFHRTGVQTPRPRCALAQHVASLRACGSTASVFYPGHVWLPPDEQATELGAHRRRCVAEAIDLWRRHGLEATIVSGGSTPTRVPVAPDPAADRDPPRHVHLQRHELRRARLLHARRLRRAASSARSSATPSQGKFVIDAGSKTLTSDRNVTAHRLGARPRRRIPGGEDRPPQRGARRGRLSHVRSARPKLGERVHRHPEPHLPVREPSGFGLASAGGRRVDGHGN